MWYEKTNLLLPLEKLFSFVTYLLAPPLIDNILKKIGKWLFLH